MNMNTMNMSCSSCGCIGENLVLIDGKWVCRDCATAAGWLVCAECGTLHREGFETSDGEHICARCYTFSGKFAYCTSCDRLHRVADMTYVNKGTWRERLLCADCFNPDDYYRCDDCGGYFTYQCVERDPYGTCLCYGCFCDGDFVRCTECNRIVNRDGALHDDDRDGWYCEGDCWDNRPRVYFHEYGYKPEPEFQTRNNESENELRFGVENEIDDGDDRYAVSEALANIGMPIYMKHDGSLGEEGVEIVTHPCTLAYHQYDMRWAEICRVSRANGYTSEDAGTCGLHIHVGRKQLGDTRDARDRVAANLVILANALWNELVTFSRREEDQLGDWADKPYVYLEQDEEDLIHDALATRCNGRYQAVNLCPSNTVEFRIFRGTLKRDTIIASLQLVSNMTKYAMQHSAEECSEASWNEVVSFEQFKELSAYCRKMGL